MNDDMFPLSTGDSRKQDLWQSSSHMDPPLHSPQKSDLALVAFLIFLIPVAAIAAATWRLTDGHLVVVLLVTAVGSFIVGWLAVIVGSGDWVQYQEVKRAYKIEHKRLLALERLHTHKILAEREAEYHRHVEEMTNKGMDELTLRLRALEEQIRQVTAGPTTSAAALPASPNYVPAKPSRPRQLVFDFLCGSDGLYTVGGSPDPKKVGSDGRILVRAPWSARGHWKGVDRDEAIKILQEPAPGKPPIIEQRDNIYYVNLAVYPNRRAVIRALGVV